MRARALRAGRKPWKWTACPPLTLGAFLDRPWLVFAGRYEEEAGTWQRRIQPHVAARFAAEGIADGSGEW